VSSNLNIAHREQAVAMEGTEGVVAG